MFSAIAYQKDPWECFTNEEEEELVTFRPEECFPILVLRPPCHACLRWLPALTHPIQMMRSSPSLCISTWSIWTRIKKYIYKCSRSMDVVSRVTIRPTKRAVLFLQLDSPICAVQQTLYCDADKDFIKHLFHL